MHQFAIGIVYLAVPSFRGLISQWSFLSIQRETEFDDSLSFSAARLASRPVIEMSIEYDDSVVVFVVVAATHVANGCRFVGDVF